MLAIRDEGIEARREVMDARICASGRGGGETGACYDAKGVARTLRDLIQVGSVCGSKTDWGVHTAHIPLRGKG
jgi:hypothetical protein